MLFQHNVYSLKHWTTGLCGCECSDHVEYNLRCVGRVLTSSCSMLLMLGSATPFSGLFSLHSPPPLATVLLLTTTAWCTLPLANHSPVTWSKCRLVHAVHYDMFVSCTCLPQAIGFLTLSHSLMLQENVLVVWLCQDDGDLCKWC